MRAAFYYPWYPEQWVQAGHRYTPVLGLYNSGNPAVMASHIDQMQYANVDVGIYSWWGRGSDTDKRFRQALDVAQERDFKWAVYYELDYNGKASWYFRVKPDLKHLAANYFDHPAYLHLNGRPVVYVYCPESSVKDAAKWKKAHTEFGAYVSLTDYPEWWTSKDNIDSWHPYRPAERLASVFDGPILYSMAVSAGFWGAGEAFPRLERNFVEWESAVSTMATYRPNWEFVYFNEHGEGTAIEPCIDTRCEAYLCSDYLGTLNTS